MKAVEPLDANDLVEGLGLAAFCDSGLLYLINKHVLHDMGFAMAVDYDAEDNVVGWSLLGSGVELWSFDAEAEGLGSAKAEAFLASRRSGLR